MKPSHAIMPLVDSCSVDRLRVLVKHRKTAYLDAITSSDNAAHINKRWRKLDESRKALAQVEGKSKRGRGKR